MELIAAPHTITVLTTNKCTAKCSHCCMNSSPTRSGNIDVSSTMAAIESLMRLWPLRVVVFAGGEPTLLKGKLLEMIERCAKIGINTRLVTNASWAVTDEKAKMWISRLRAAGLHELNISTDDYHIDYIPFDNVVRAWQAAKSQGFRSVVIAGCAHPGSKISPEFIEAALGETLPRRFDDDGMGEPLPPPAEDGTIYLLSNSQFQSIGRGAREVDLSHRVVPSDESRLDLPCPFAVRSAALTPSNHFVACCGFELEGNATLDFGRVTDDQSMREALRAANDDVLVAAIMLYGPKYLMDKARAKDLGLTFLDKYASVCEICEHVVGRPEVVEVLRANSGEIAADVLAHPALNAAAAAAAS